MDKKFPGLKVEQISFFNKLLQQTKTNHYDWIKNQYSNKFNNFEELYSLLLEAKLIVSKEKKVILAPAVKKISTEFFLISLLRYSYLSEHLVEYFKSFNTLDEQIIYNPTRSEKIKFSNIRNFLIEAGYIKYNTKTQIYYFLPKKYKELKNIIVESDSVLSPELLDVIQKKQKIIGENAEIAVMDYEKRRLSNYPNLQKSLKHVAKYNSTAGHDIRSWCVELKEDSNPTERYIEVKAISSNEIKFYWSRNEIEKAEEYGKYYYLYLLPIIDENEFDIANLEKISDPYKKVFLNQEWDQRIENYLFRK